MGDELEEDNNIDKAFKKLQKKKDKFHRFQKKREARVREKKLSSNDVDYSSLEVKAKVSNLMLNQLFDAKDFAKANVSVDWR